MLGLKTHINNEILPIFYKALFKLFFRFTKPVSLPKTGDVVISTMTYHGAVDIMILSLKSFFYSAGIRLPLFVFDDGTLTKNDYEKIKRHLINVHLLTKKNNDVRMKKVLKLYKYSNKFRFTAFEFRFNLKLFDPFLLPRYKKLIYIDHDVLFLNTPLELVNWIKSKDTKNLYVSEFLYQKGVPGELTETWQIIEKMFMNKFAMRFPRWFNSGLICINSGDYSLYEIEKVLSYLYKVGLQETWAPEQYTLAYLLSRARSLDLKEKGYLNLTRKDFSLISSPFSYKSIHFANLARRHYYKIALLLLWQNINRFF